MDAKSEKVPVGVVVKYHPCSTYARGGLPCPHFKGGSKRCSKIPKQCEMPEYDKWFKDVLSGKISYFFSPRHIRIFTVLAGVPLFVYHSHKKSIVGEAAIYKVTKEENLFNYWFNEFIHYPNYVDPTNIKTDESLQSLKNRGRWSIRYLTDEAVREIREYANLPADTKERLNKAIQELGNAIKVSSFRPPVYKKREKLLSLTKRELAKIESKYKLDKAVINKTYEIITEISKKGLLRGRSAKDLFFASLYAAHRAVGIPISLKDFSNQYNLTRRVISRNYFLILKSLDSQMTIPMLSAKDFLLKYSQLLPVSEKTVNLALSIIQDIKNSLRQGRSRRVVAATALYIACIKNNEKLTQKQIAKAFGTTDVSIRNFVKSPFIKRIFKGKLLDRNV